LASLGPGNDGYAGPLDSGRRWAHLRLVSHFHCSSHENRNRATEMREGRRGPGGGKLGPLVSAPGWPRMAGDGEALTNDFRLALRQVRLVVLPFALHRDSLLKRRRLPSK